MIPSTIHSFALFGALSIAVSSSLLSTATATTGSPSRSIWGVPSSDRRRTGSLSNNNNNNEVDNMFQSVLQSTRGGGESGNDDSAPSIPSGGAAVPSTSYASKLDAVKDKVLQKADAAMEELRTSIMNEATAVDDFGSKADTIINKALEDFAKSAPETDSDDSGDLYDTKLLQVESALDAPLQVLFLRQLSLLRDKALLRFQSAAKTSGVSEYEAMLQADAYFTREAESSCPSAVVDEWDYSSERSALQNIMNTIVKSDELAKQIRVTAGQQQQTAMQVLQQQQQMIQQMQMQLYGQTSPWNVGVAYRIPDTNFNLQGSYQQGKTNLQLSCVPDEYAPFLGPNGFTQGVGPGNLGLSLNLSV